MRFLWIIAPVLILSAVQLRADSVTLLTGEKISGTIKGQTDTEVVIDVPVSASITDERVIQKKDVAKIDQAQPDEILFKQLIAVQPSTELSFTPDEYDRILASLSDFEKQYPSSTYLPEIKKLAATFQDEKNHVDKGEIKYVGRWLSRQEAAAREVQIDGLNAYKTMRQQAAGGNLVDALQTYTAIEHQYSSTRAFPAAVTLARQIIPNLVQDLAGRMQQIRTEQEELRKTIAFTAPVQRPALIAQAKAEQDRANAMIAEALKNGVIWVPLIPRSQVSIDTLQKIAASEASRLAAIPVPAMIASIEKSDAARNAFLDGDYKTADTLLKDSSSLWPQNEAVRYWSTQLKLKTASPTPLPHPSASPKPMPSAPRPAPEAGNNAANSSAASDNKPFYMTITGSITIAAVVLIVGGIIASISQRKARKEAAQ